MEIKKAQGFDKSEGWIVKIVEFGFSAFRGGLN